MTSTIKTLSGCKTERPGLKSSRRKSTCRRWKTASSHQRLTWGHQKPRKESHQPSAIHQETTGTCYHQEMILAQFRFLLDLSITRTTISSELRWLLRLTENCRNRRSSSSTSRKRPTHHSPSEVTKGHNSVPPVTSTPEGLTSQN